ncbi:nuclear transport factor 2 family protein [Nannocystis bainbridge]|uniref:Nuclear transport factor 2 family protein n=1 Tax=Nannocystis bainbridge TaxID=2995303 RepID=A0ABT5DVB5_9BACT|nr:nuclear transport factor 2 family protein [Nannocystis bainbridge]MDC0716643.1 nuclear transport factor 2 family protein [Nannocystis bainbridge]
MTTDNRNIVERALARVIETGDIDTLEPLLSADFVHHRPGSSSRTRAEWLAAARPVPMGDMQVEIQHMLAAGDHVVMYSQRRLPGAGPGIAVVDIWRFEAGLIAEAWEIIEPVAQAPANFEWWKSAAHPRGREAPVA